MRRGVAGRENLVQIRVRYPEVDRMGVAHHASHFVWFEIGRTELMRGRGIAYARLEDEGVFLPVIEAHCVYRAPARYDDLLKVRTSLVSAGPVRVTFDYRVEREADGTLLATGRTLHAAVDGRGRPRRLPPAIRDLLT
jgi:acyl-CoA thioester hydrolase